MGFSTEYVLNLYLNYISDRRLFDKRYGWVNDKQGKNKEKKVKNSFVPTTWVNVRSLI